LKKTHFIILFCFAAALRLAFIWKAPLWYDENFTYLLSQLPFENMIRATAGDVHPPLFYIISWLVQRMGGPPWLLRMPSAAFSLWALYLFRRVLQVLNTSPRIQTAALFLMAVLPFQLWFAQEARMYAMLEAFVLLGVLAIHKRHWTTLFLASLGMLYTHNHAVFYLPFIVLSGLLSGQKQKDAKRMLWVPILAFLSWLPWASVVFSQISQIDNNYWITPIHPGMILDMLNKLFWIAAQPDSLYLPAYLLVISALLIGCWYALRYRPAGWTTILLLGFGPAILATLVSLLWQPIFLYRHLVGSAPFLYLLVSLPLGSLEKIDVVSRKRSLVYLGLVVAPLLMTGLAGYYLRTPDMKRNQSRKPYMRSALTDIEKNWQHGDIFYHITDASLVNTMAYTPDLPHYKMPNCEPGSGGLSEATRTAMGVRTAPLDEIEHQRAWIIAAVPIKDPACYPDSLAAILDEAPLILIDNNPSAMYGIWVK